jgi:hypothetical protein
MENYIVAARVAQAMYALTIARALFSSVSLIAPSNAL